MSLHLFYIEEVEKSIRLGRVDGLLKAFWKDGWMIGSGTLTGIFFEFLFLLLY